MNQSILITGASSGIGQETAYKLAIQGATLILTARRIDRLKVVQRQCKQLGAQTVTVFPMDLSKTEDIDRLVSFVNKKKLSVDVLINNAGFGYAGSFISTDTKTIQQLFQVNVLGLMYLTQKIAIQMLDQGKGQIINQASLAGKVATAEYSIYAATKAAVISFSNALRMELKAFNIDITVVNLGPVDTPFFDRIDGKRKEKTLNSFFTLTMSQAAQILTDAVGSKKREINRPRLLSLGAKLSQLAPAVVESVVLKYYN